MGERECEQEKEPAEWGTRKVGGTPWGLENGLMILLHQALTFGAYNYRESAV